MPFYIDTHAHIYDDVFKDDISEVITNCIKSGVTKIVMPAIDSSYHNNMISLSSKFNDNLYPSIGLHPTSVNSGYNQELSFIEEKLESSKFIAIGEIGIDGYWSKEFIKEQIICFKRQIELALKYNLPIIIHSRNATEEIFNAISDYKGSNLRGVFHAFSGSLETYERAKKLGDFKFGIGGVVTYKNSNLGKIVKEIPLNDIVLETDSPWLTPVPYRGKRNDPSKIEIIAKSIADIKGLPINDIADHTTNSASKLFKI